MIAAVRALRTYTVVFLFAALPFGLVFAVLTGDETTGLVSGLVFGVLMSAIIGTLQVSTTRGLPSGSSTRPRQTISVPLVPDPYLADRIVWSLRSLPAELEHADVPAGRYVARTGTSWASWGEEVVVQLTGSRSAPVAQVSSAPRVRTTLVDYGRGARNVHRVAAALTGRA